MAMGKTGTVNITPQMMRDALNAIDEYEKKAGAQATKLEDTMSALYPGNFSGSAADGFNTFYTQKIVPIVGENLTKLLTAVRSIVQGTLEAIPDTNGLDDKLGEENSKS